MERILNEVISQEVVDAEVSAESLRKQFNELDQLQLAMVGGGIADIIGI